MGSDIDSHKCVLRCDLLQLGWELVDEFFDVICLVAVCHENGVVGLDDDEVIDS